MPSRFLEGASASIQKCSPQGPTLDVNAAADGCPGACITSLAQGIVYEISCTLCGVVGIVDLGKFPAPLHFTYGLPQVEQVSATETGDLVATTEKS